MEQASIDLSPFKLPLKGGVILVISLLLIGWLFNTPTGLLGKTDAIGYAVCHRIEARSFQLHGRPLPLCARCTGMYLGAVLGIVFQWAIGRRRSGLPSLPVCIGLSFFVLAFGIDGINSYLHLSMMQELLPGIPRLYEPSNTLRLFTGTGMGLVIAAALTPVFNQTVWAKGNPRPLLSWQSALALVLLAVCVDLLVLTEHVLVLYPAAIASSFGVLLILTMVYSMVWIMLRRHDNRYDNLRQLALPLWIGFGVALLQIATLDSARYWLTGTWAGFSF
ncbi:MAG: DUF2085 domain-containing protein [Chloroflexota bacterium]